MHVSGKEKKQNMGNKRQNSWTVTEAAFCPRGHCSCFSIVYYEIFSYVKGMLHGLFRG